MSYTLSQSSGGTFLKSGDKSVKLFYGKRYNIEYTGGRLNNELYEGVNMAGTNITFGSTTIPITNIAKVTEAESIPMYTGGRRQSRRQQRGNSKRKRKTRGQKSRR
jgi:hypothetical protein